MTKRKAGTAARAGQPSLEKPTGSPAVGSPAAGPSAAGSSALGSSAAGVEAVPGAGGPAGRGAEASRAGGPSSEKPAGSSAAGGPSLEKPAASSAAGWPSLEQPAGEQAADAPPFDEVAAGGAGDGPVVPQAGYTVPAAAEPLPAAGPDAGPEGQRTAHLPGGPLDIAITVGGLVLAVLLAVALAVVEAFLAPLRVSDLGFTGPGQGNVRIPLALVLALVTNPLLGWFAYTTSGRRFAALLPAGAWCVVWILAAGRTSEGDLLITNDNWVGLLTLFTGPLAFAIGIYVTALRHRAAASANSKATPLAPQSVDR